MAKTYIPTDGMASAARRALKWKEEGKRGGTRVGLARANQLANKEALSQDTVLRMHSFFSRHEVDKQAEGFNSGENGFPSPGRVAWDLWGGDAGASWSSQKRDQIMNERMNKSVWSGVFFPADEPALVEVPAEQDFPLDTPMEENPVPEMVADINENTSVTNEVEETPEFVDETVAEEDTNTEAIAEVSDSTDIVDETPLDNVNTETTDTVDEVSEPSLDSIQPE